MQIVSTPSRLAAASVDLAVAAAAPGFVLLGILLLRHPPFSRSALVCLLGSFLFARLLQGRADGGGASWGRRLASSSVAGSSGDPVGAAEGIFRRVAADSFVAVSLVTGVLFASWRARTAVGMLSPWLFGPVDWAVAAFVALDLEVLFFLWSRRGGSQSWPHDRLLRTIVVETPPPSLVAPALPQYRDPIPMRGVAACGDLAAFAKRLLAEVADPPPSMRPAPVLPTGSAPDPGELFPGATAPGGVLSPGFVLPAGVAGRGCDPGPADPPPRRPAAPPSRTPPPGGSGASPGGPSSVADAVARLRAGGRSASVPRYGFAGAGAPGSPREPAAASAADPSRHVREALAARRRRPDPAAAPPAGTPGGAPPGARLPRRPPAS